jgi:hypothetical protein
MVSKSFMQSTALAVLAAVGAMAVPAQAQEQNQDRHEARAAMREARQAQRAERQEARQEPRVSTPQQAQARSWNRGGGDGQARAEARPQRQWQQQPGAPEGGWRSQRAAEGQRYGRDWQNDGAVNRPAPAWRGATPQTPDRGVTDQARAERWGERNRTYTDPNRSTAYGGYRDRTTQSWRDRQGDRATTYREGYRDGRTADSYRDRRDQTQAYRQGYGSASRDYRRWDRDDWRRDNRYNWSGYRNQHRELYRIGRYYSPYSNYRYSRLNIGFFLQPLFYSRNYWIDDPYQYRLPEVYGPYRWVRYYDDALLVDIYSGEVVDVIHDFFW